MIFKQVHLIDVEKSAVGPRQQARLERFLAARQRALQIERADHAVLRRAKRQIDHRHGHELRLELGFLAARAAIAAMRDIVVGIALIAAADDRLHLRQQHSQSAHRGGFAGAAVAECQNAAHLRIDCRDRQRKLHLVLTHDR